MLTLSELLADIEASEPGPGTAAIFDFDGTIIAGYSATVFLQDALTRGELKKLTQHYEANFTSHTGVKVTFEVGYLLLERA